MCQTLLSFQDLFHPTLNEEQLLIKFELQIIIRHHRTTGEDNTKNKSSDM